MTAAVPRESGPAPSAEQQAVRDRAGQPTVLVAAAGSGKTRVLTWLYTDAHLQEGIGIERLLAITFTNRAAGELRERIATALAGTALGRDPDLTEAWIGTFHGICARLLREFAHHRGIDPGFAVLDDLTSAELLERAWEDALELILDEHGHAAADLVAQVGEAPLRGAVIGWWRARRSAGDVHPALPTPTTGDEDVRAAVRQLRRAGEELAAVVEERINPNKPGKRLSDIRASVEATEGLADEIDALVGRPPVTSREAARATLRLEEPKVPGGAPLGDHPARLGFLEAREAVSRRLGELVAGPRVATVAHLARAFSEAYEARKRADECLDHDDLELETLELLRHEPAVRQRIAERFARILVDEFQDTNPRQAELVQLLAGDRPWLLATPGDGAPAVTVVGDPRQAIYGFRHADVELILAAERDAPAEAALRLSTNYRSDAEVLGAIDRAWARLYPDTHEPVAADRGPDALPGGEPRVELLITKEDSTDPWDGEALGGRPGEETGAPLAEARLVAARIAELLEQEPDRNIAVLARARRALIPIAEALAVLGVEAVQDGAAGFWERLEVADLLAWLRLVRNAQDDAALIAVLASPLVGVSADGLTVVGELGVPEAGRLAAIREALSVGRFGADDHDRIEAALALLGAHRQPGRAEDPCALLDELIAATRYDEHLARLGSSARRLANVARLRRLAADEVAGGGDTTTLVDRAASEQRHELRAPEAALGGSGAVQLMTVHQAKGLEFDTVVVAGLGARRPATPPALLGDERRLGLKLRPAPGARSLPLFEHAALAAELTERELAELRRVLYVALTRARERLIVSGVGTWTQKDGPPFGRELRPSSPVVDWLVPALIPEANVLIPQAIAGGARSAEGLGFVISTPGGEVLAADRRNPRRAELPEHRPAIAQAPNALAGPRPLPAPELLSYTALSRHASCGLRFYAEEVLQLAPTVSEGVPQPAATPGPVALEAATPPAGRRRRGAPTEGQLSLFGAPAGSTGAPAEPTASPIAASGHTLPGLAANTVGTIVHAVLERAEQAPSTDAIRAAVQAEAAAEGAAAVSAEDAERMAALVGAALRSPVWSQLWSGGEPARERAFTIAVGPEAHLLTGVVDAQAKDGAGGVLVVDYKTDRLEGEVDLATHVASRYALQRAAYALAALRAGAERVRVVHLFLDGGSGREAELRVTAADAAQLEDDLLRAVRVVAGGEAGATIAPDAITCDACPARGTVCRWPVEQTRRAPGSGPADPAQWMGPASALRASG
ncbi:MAG: UvrD-helicase domain-containing protein [Solirubrobacteraceae bacterium]|nr:UvrD-helicase domain-containing protein [Solirubrobacteraceae bacterium]